VSDGCLVGLERGGALSASVLTGGHESGWRDGEKGGTGGKGAYGGVRGGTGGVRGCTGGVRGVGVGVGGGGTLAQSSARRSITPSMPKWMKMMLACTWVEVGTLVEALHERDDSLAKPPPP
jgi:hypothetical protein